MYIPSKTCRRTGLWGCLCVLCLVVVLVRRLNINIFYEEHNIRIWFDHYFVLRIPYLCRSQLEEHIYSFHEDIILGSQFREVCMKNNRWTRAGRYTKQSCKHFPVSWLEMVKSSGQSCHVVRGSNRCCSDCASWRDCSTDPAHHTPVTQTHIINIDPKKGKQTLSCWHHTLSTHAPRDPVGEARRWTHFSLLLQTVSPRATAKLSSHHENNHHRRAGCGESVLGVILVNIMDSVCFAIGRWNVGSDKKKHLLRLLIGCRSSLLNVSSFGDEMWAVSYCSSGEVRQVRSAGLLSSPPSIVCAIINFPRAVQY